MLINNFYLGLLGFTLLFPTFYLSLYGVGYINKILGEIVNFLQQHKLYPILSIFVEPAKVLFLNNAINHGVFTPLGLSASNQVGKSILFLIETNPGPGFGVLAA